MCKSFLMIFVSVLSLVVLTTAAYASERWLSIGTITSTEAAWIRGSIGYDYNRYGIALSEGWDFSDRFSAYLELTTNGVTWSKHKTQLEVGLTANLRIFPLKRKNMLFTDVGVGMGYTMGSSPSDNTLGPPPVGLINAGVGLLIPLSNKVWLVPQYKVRHTSSFFRSDIGINTHGPEVGLAWRW